MRIANHQPTPRYRSFSGPAILSQGFRPFFVLAGVWAALALPISVEMILGRIVPAQGVDPVMWHVHEMLFGFVAAVVAGFLLTAIPNWTGRLPLSGMPLLGLVLCWVAGRVAFVSGGALSPLWVAVLDVSFLAVLLALTVREIVRGRNWRNVPVISILAVFLGSNVLLHVEMMEMGGVVGGVDGMGQRLAIAAVTVLITLIGGRVTPSFTRNALMKLGAQKLPAAFDTYDRVTLAVTVLALVFWVLAPITILTAALLGLAAVLNGGRLARWCGWATYREPLLWVLHVGYAWVPLGLGILAIDPVWSDLTQGAALHALTSGAMGTMTLAMMSRASLGHTGRPLRAGTALTLAYLLVIAAAALRVSAPLWGGAYPHVVSAAMGAWSLGFALFVAQFAPLLLKRRT